MGRGTWGERGRVDEEYKNEKYDDAQIRRLTLIESVGHGCSWGHEALWSVSGRAVRRRGPPPGHHEIKKPGLATKKSIFAIKRRFILRS